MASVHQDINHFIRLWVCDAKPNVTEPRLYRARNIVKSKSENFVFRGDHAMILSCSANGNNKSARRNFCSRRGPQHSSIPFGMERLILRVRRHIVPRQRRQKPKIFFSLANSPGEHIRLSQYRPSQQQ